MIITSGKGGLPTPRRYFAIATISLAVLLSTSVVNVTLPAIARDIGSTAVEREVTRWDADLAGGTSVQQLQKARSSQ